MYVVFANDAPRSDTPPRSLLFEIIVLFMLHLPYCAVIPVPEYVIVLLSIVLLCPSTHIP